MRCVRQNIMEIQHITSRKSHDRILGTKVGEFVDIVPRSTSQCVGATSSRLRNYGRIERGVDFCIHLIAICVGPDDVVGQYDWGAWSGLPVRESTELKLHVTASQGGT